MSKNQLIGLVVSALVVGGASFYGGIQYQKSQAPVRGQFSTGVGGAGGFAGRTGGRGIGGFTAGKILSVGNGSLTLQSMTSSSTEIVLTGPSTQIEKTVAGSGSDLSVGSNVVVTGTPNSDGSLTAASIQIRPAGTNFGPRGAGQ